MLHAVHVADDTQSRVDPQGNLSERIRAAGDGIGTFECTPQGLKLIDKVDGLAHAELEKLVGLPIAV